MKLDRKPKRKILHGQNVGDGRYFPNWTKEYIKEMNPDEFNDDHGDAMSRRDVIGTVVLLCLLVIWAYLIFGRG